MTDKISDAALHEVMEAAREPVPKSHPARFRAWQEYCNKVDANWIPHDHEAARAAFVAGWEARKRAQYSGDAS
jgi:hypothetical protein